LCGGVHTLAMAHFMPPALLQLFTPRAALDFKNPPPRDSRPKIEGFAEFVKCFTPEDELPPVENVETQREKKERLKKKKMEEHKIILEEREKNWDPHKNMNATKDAYKTLFVARLSYEVDEEDLKEEFKRYGDVREVKLVRDARTGKSRGYAFIEFDSSQDLKDAFKYADGKSIKGRRILVDVERGRTVPGWKPRKLGGGMGSTRSGDENRRSRETERSDERYKSRRDKYRDRDYRDRDRARRRRSRSRETSTRKSTRESTRERTERPSRSGRQRR